MATVTELLDLARSQIGTLETTGMHNGVLVGNIVKYKKNPYDGNPWCGSFTDWCFRNVSMVEPSSVYTPNGAAAYKRAGRWYTTPQIGDVAYFDFPDNKYRIQHIGIVESFGPNSVTTIDGNTSSGASGSQDDGGGVFRRTRSRSVVVGYGRPSYAVSVVPKPVENTVDPDHSYYLEGPIVSSVMAANGKGVYLLAQSGAVYTFPKDAPVPFPKNGSVNGKAYWGNRKAAKIALAPPGSPGPFRVTATTGEPYIPE